MTSLNNKCKACGHMRGEHYRGYNCTHIFWLFECACMEFEEGYQDEQRTFTVTERVMQTRIDCQTVPE